MKNTPVGLSGSPVLEKLMSLAREPYDLTVPGALTKDNRLARYQSPGELLQLHYGTERVDGRVLEALQQLADDCQLTEQFKAMRQGAILNCIDGFESENRQVLHTAVRDIFTENPAEPASTRDAKTELDKLHRFLQAVDSGEIVNEQGQKFTTMVQVGIGGSDLGPRSIHEALKAYQIPGRTISFVSNVDPDDVAEVVERLDLSRTLFNIVSKSGTTLETLTNEEYIRAVLRNAGLNPDYHCLAVTGQGSPMDNPAKYLATFYMYDYIGGRYSVTSMVGLVVLGFSLGFESVREFLRGASEMDNQSEENSIVKNIPLMMALLGVWNHNILGYPTVAVLPYSQALHRFTAHLQQCDMESNGKSISRNGEAVQTKTGPIVWGEPGTNGQHAFYQLLHQGTDVVPVEFIGFLESQRGQDIEVEGSTSQQKLIANLLAQLVAMATGDKNSNPNKQFAGNRPSLLLFARKLTPRTMGALLACYEAKIVFQGFLWDINSFDQEGVQLGKVLATRFLAEITRANRGGYSVESAFVAEVLGSPIS